MSLNTSVNPIRVETTDDGGSSGALAGLGISNHSTEIKILQTWVILRDDPNPVESIDQILSEDPVQETSGDAGWMVMLSYELGRRIESKAKHNRVGGPNQTTYFDAVPDFPLAVVQRWRACDCGGAGKDGQYTIGAIRSSMGKDGYIAAVERTKSYIREGDIYQANIAHHLRAPFTGNARSCFEDLVKSSKPRLGSMMIFDHDDVRHAILSVSPELFLEYDAQSGTIRTEPMKGTRPIGSDVAELRDSIKDQAELDMITDLMRNDLGRVCRLGSVRVIDPRRIESHGSGVLQASSTIEGHLADGVGFGEIINATFPPGSVTGAPKVRAMQVIDELENRARDSYCGSILVLDDHGSIKGSVSIRTTHIWGGVDPDGPDSIKDGCFVYPVGAGVVADSDPESEWAETLMKASVLRSALGIEIR